MKLSRIIPIFMLMGGISTLALSCAPKTISTSTTQSQTVTVQRGNLNIAITTVGNLALSEKQDLAFEIPGTVQDVLVAAGDTVTKGQVLSTLDTTQWDSQLVTYQRAVTAAEQTLTQKQIGLRNAQYAVVTANNTVTSRQFTLRTAQFDYQTANDTLNQITANKQAQDSINSAQAEIDSATIDLNFANNMLAVGFKAGAFIDYGYWNTLKSFAEQALAQARNDMQNAVAGTGLSSSVTLDVAKKQLTVEQKQLGITQAQLDLQNAQLAVNDAQNAIAPAQLAVQNAQDDLKTAQQTLDDAKSNSPEVTAPFDGFITAVSVKGGDVVQKGKVAVTIADPTKFEADLLVNETDISKIRLGATASVALQDISGVSLSANVTNIAPTATNSQGVVNYKVTVELRPLEPVGQALGQFSGNITSGNVSLGLPFGGGGPGPGSSNLTQSQISQATQQRQQAAAGQPGRGSQAAGSTATDVRLSDGMTVTVTILVDSRTNVLLVPNGAITTSGGQTSVKVVNADNTTANRAIQTGITDRQNTEVTSGLSAGEKVMVTRTTTTSGATSTNQQTTQGVVIPGVGGLGGGAFGR